MGSATSGWSQTLDVLDAVHIGVVVGIVIALLLAGMSMVAPPSQDGWGPGLRTLDEWGAAGSPPTASLPGAVALGYHILEEAVGLFLDVLAALLSTSAAFVSIFLGIVGAILAWASTVGTILNKNIQSALKSAAPYVDLTMVAGASLGTAIPILEASQL